jgi:hypothetical protein
MRRSQEYPYCYVRQGAVPLAGEEGKGVPRCLKLPRRAITAPVLRDFSLVLLLSWALSR